jgi:hypothetical protein
MWNPLNDIRYGVELERAQMTDNGLNESPGMWNSLWGSVSGATQQGVDNKRQAVRHAAGSTALRNSGYTREELDLKPGAKLTEGQVSSAIRNYGEQKQEGREEKAHQRSMEPLAAQLQSQTELGRQQLAQSNAQFNTTLKSQEARYAHESEQNRLQRGFDRERGEARDMLSMQIAQMDSQLADKRMAYDRETRRMDRRDQMIAQLMSGLGQLGGAFSL